MTSSVAGETRDIENKTVQSQKDQLSNQILEQRSAGVQGACPARSECDVSDEVLSN
jgi:hypothetical protein